MSDARPEWGVVQLHRDLRIVASQLVDIAHELLQERRQSTIVADRATMTDNAAGAEECAHRASTIADSADYWLMYDALARAMQEHLAARQILNQWRELHSREDARF